LKTLYSCLLIFLLMASLAFAECRVTLCNATPTHVLSLQIDNGPISQPVKLGELTAPITIPNGKYIFKALENGKVIAQEAVDLLDYDAYIWTIDTK
jgi:hypothetical protein